MYYKRNQIKYILTYLQRRVVVDVEVMAHEFRAGSGHEEGISHRPHGITVTGLTGIGRHVGSARAPLSVRRGSDLLVVRSVEFLLIDKQCSAKRLD